ncbi:hypothetical protein NDU88_002432 [Pleurodeles waltl]|uniref:Uncharacterized protein n=1 Tax=Pleurodeles waltl TaxID=8319 RepID=A0AAV7LCC2_PLEWA|nr:hypothetical protein NDU88_002432 [Pleurodeles waltl]
MRRDGGEIGTVPSLGQSTVSSPMLELHTCRWEDGHTPLTPYRRGYCGGPLLTCLPATHRALQLQQIEPGTQSSRNALHGLEG